MIQETFPVGPLQCNCTVLGDPASLEAMVIDPGGDVVRILGVLARHRLTLKAIIVTHAHLDHIAGAQSLKEATGAPILYHQADLALVAVMDQQAAWMGVATPEVLPPDASADAGTVLHLGGTDLHVLHTPGHTPGSISVYVPSQSLLLAGDTLFRGGIGRTDLWLGDGRTILESIRSQLLHLPEGTRVISGHGASTTIAHERERNPFLQVLPNV